MGAAWAEALCELELAAAGAQAHLLQLLRLRATEPVRLWTTHWANAETSCQMLGVLRDSYPGRRLVLVWDNVRYHHALAARRYAEELGITLW